MEDDDDFEDWLIAREECIMDLDEGEVNKDIEFIKELIEQNKIDIKGVSYGKQYSILRTIKIILAEREQDKARIKKLEREKNYLSQDNEILARGNFKKFKFLNYSYVDTPKIEMEEYKSNDYINKNYIPVQKVKDKIEELKKDYEDSKDENGETEYYYPDYTIRKLEELLEDK